MAEPSAKRARVEGAGGAGGDGDGDGDGDGPGGVGRLAAAVAAAAARRTAERDDPDMFAALLSDSSLSPALVGIMTELDKLNEEASDKVLEIEQAYSRLRRPIYARRAGILRQVAGFWGQAIGNHPAVRGVLTAEDTDILGYCTEIDVQDYDDIRSGYRIVFHFSPENPYFSETELVKTFTYQQGGSLRITATQPTWADKYEPAEQADPSSGSAGCAYHFFRWFMEPEQEILEGNDEIAELIKEDIWPDPMRFWAHEGEWTDDEEDVVIDDELRQADAYEVDEDELVEEGDDIGVGEGEDLPEPEDDEEFEGEEGDGDGDEA